MKVVRGNLSTYATSRTEYYILIVQSVKRFLEESLHGLDNKNVIFRPGCSIRAEISPHYLHRNVYCLYITY